MSVFSQDNTLISTIQTENLIPNKKLVLEKCRAYSDVFFVNINPDNAFNHDSLLVKVGDESISVKKEIIYSRGDNSFLFVGKGDNCQVLMSVLSDDIQGIIELGHNVYSIETTDDSGYALISTDYSVLNEVCSNFMDDSPNHFNDSELYDIVDFRYDTFCKIRVLVFYTSSAKSSVSNIQNTVFTAIALTNQSFANSQIAAQVELVFAGETDYSESGNIFTDLDRFRIDNDGYMDAVHALRDIYSADVCVLLLNDPNTCGLASTINAVPYNAFCAVSTYGTCATSNYSFAHEIGHLLGCRHDTKADPTTTPYQYGHGYVQSKKKWRTIMSYASSCSNCPRLLYWSNPDELYQGEHMGTHIFHNNSLVWNNRHNIVSTFRQPRDTVFLSDYNHEILSGHIVAERYITNFGEITIQSNSNIDIVSGYEITFNDGFIIEEGASFTASIGDVFGCNYMNLHETRKSDEENNLSDIFEYDNHFEYSIFPNPATRKINILFSMEEEKKATIYMMDVLGHITEVISGEKITNSGKCIHSIDVTNYKPGIYFISICLDEQRFTEKIIINR